MSDCRDVFRETARRMPKVSLHVHLEGAVAATTAVELAAQHGIALPGGRTAADLYDVDAHADLAEFLRVYDVVGSVVRTAADFHRITYETLALAAGHQVIHREMFVSPQAHPDVPYAVLLDGVVAGIHDAEADHGITCRVIVALNRERSPAEALELVEEVLARRVDHVVGIGLDYAEMLGPPERFAKAFALAGRAGLGRTAHSESGPPSNITTLLDVLGCSRVDHGYHVLDDPAVTARCADTGVTFTCTPVSSEVTHVASPARIAAMMDAGLAVAIDCDDPPMFATDPTHDHEVLGPALDHDPERLLATLDHAVAGCWLDDTERAALRARALTAV